MRQSQRAEATGEVSPCHPTLCTHSWPGSWDPRAGTGSLLERVTQRSGPAGERCPLVGSKHSGGAPALQPAEGWWEEKAEEKGVEGTQRPLRELATSPSGLQTESSGGNSWGPPMCHGHVEPRHVSCGTASSPSRSIPPINSRNPSLSQQRPL